MLCSVTHFPARSRGSFNAIARYWLANFGWATCRIIKAKAARSTLDSEIGYQVTVDATSSTTRADIIKRYYKKQDCARYQGKAKATALLRPHLSDFFSTYSLCGLLRLTGSSLRRWARPEERIRVLEDSRAGPMWPNGASECERSECPTSGPEGARSAGWVLGAGVRPRSKMAAASI